MIRMGDIRVGDTLFDEKGCPCTVLAIHPIFTPEKAYRLTFDDGSELDACSDHLWLTYDISELSALTRRDPEWRARRRSERPSRVTGNKSARFTESLRRRNAENHPPTKPAPAGSIRTTQEIFDTLRVGRRTNHAIPVCKALQLPDADLPLAPILLGYWLGDGGSKTGLVFKPDKEIPEAFREAGFEVISKNDNLTHSVHGLVPILKQLGVFGDKHIPQMYLRASAEQRLALLQGLCDSDGYASPEDGGVEFTTTRRILADQVLELICSLGMKAAIREGRATLYGKDCGPKYRINWQPNQYVFRIPRKREHQKLATRRTTQFRYITDCKAIPPVPVRCITVDSPSGLYLAGKTMIPTHNTWALLAESLRFVHLHGYRAMIFRRTVPQLTLPDGLVDASRELFEKQGQYNDNDKRWLFPNGSTISFGHMQYEADKQNYKGAQLSFLGIDQVEDFSETQYTYLLSRVRSKCACPRRVRVTANPPDDTVRYVNDPAWVKRRWLSWLGTDEELVVAKLPRAVPGEILWFLRRNDVDTLVPPNTKGALSRTCIPATVYDNPTNLEQNPEYVAQLENAPLLDRERLLNGNWNIVAAGNLLKREWFVTETSHPKGLKWVRYWDLAYSIRKKAHFTATALAAFDKSDGRVYVRDMERWKQEWPDTKEKIIERLLREHDVECGIEAKLQGRPYIQELERDPRFVGHKLRGVEVDDNKADRVKVWSPRAEKRKIVLVQGNWVPGFLSEAEVFDGLSTSPDDQVDVVSGCVQMMGVSDWRETKFLAV
jgi:predicted phage terminase large subunit-like protein